jgi:hypothetical protein
LKEFGIKLSTANVYIRLYEHKDDDKLKDAKSISEARAALPPERGGGGGDNSDDDDAGDDDDSDDDNPVDELSDKDREQVASEFIRSRNPKKLYDQLVGILDDKELFELYQLLGQRFSKPAPTATAVANQASAVPKPATTFDMPGLTPKPVSETPLLRR